MAVDDVINQTKEKLESVLAPIGGGAGADVSYDEQFDLVKNEVEKMTSMSGGKVDWGVVASNADELLADKGKDFRVALYFAAARVNQDGVSGLFEGFVLLQELCANFWTTMGPPLKRPKARGNLCTWFGELASPLIATYQPTAAERDLVKALDQVSRGVDGNLRDKLGDAYGGLSSLRSNIQNLVRALPPEAPPPPPPPPPKPPEPPKPVEAPRAAPVAAPVETSAPEEAAAPVYSGAPGLSLESITDVDAARAALDSLGPILVRAAEAIRAADPGDASAYRLLRTGSWLQIEQTPPSDGGVTMIPAPGEYVRERFAALAAEENWLVLIAVCEEVLLEQILWLDPHRYIAMAMDRLGAIFMNAKKAHLRELAYLLVRAPKLPDLQFNDGVPLADPQTKAWIESEVIPVLGAGGGGGGGAAANPLDGPINEARSLAGTGNLPDAITLLAKAAAAAPTPAGRFRGQLAIANLCLEGGQLAIARAQLEGLERIAERHHLAEWEPALCAELYAALYAAHKGLNGGEYEVPPEARAKQAAVFERLCQLDAGAALKLSIA